MLLLTCLKKNEMSIIKTKQKQETKQNISLEALIIDKLIKEQKTIKEIVEILNKENKNISKKDLYNASLNLKQILKK